MQNELEKGKWAETQLNEEQAIKMYDSNVWKNWTPEQVVRVQLFQECLCVNFGHFQNCLEQVLGRSVFTHELAYRDNIVLEYLEAKKAPTFDDIMNLLPENRFVI